MRHVWLPVVLVCACTSDNQVTTLHPEIAVSPAALDFGEVVVDVDAPTVDVFVTNGGRADLDVALSIVGDSGFTIVGETTFTVEVDGALTIPIQFDPTELVPYAADLILTTNDPDDGGIVTIPLTGIGRVPYAPDIELRADDGSPSTLLDFGDVYPSADEVFQIANVGDADLDLTGVLQTGAGTFSLVSDDPSGNRVAPGGALTVIVHYDATLTNGDSGAIEIESNDPDEPKVTMALEANGGGSFEYPVAVIDCPALIDVAGPVVVPLDGAGSYDPQGGALAAYEWALVQVPAGADPTRTLDPTDAVATTLVVDAVGTWEVSLTVTNDAGFRSVPAKCQFPAESIDDLHVELTWSGSTSDLDLHLATGDAELFTVPGDTSWCNASPDWGVAGDPDDDGHLDLDDDYGYGPEHVGVNVPADGTYVVRVHHFDDGDDGDVTATVGVFTRNELVWSGSQILARNEVWDVGQVNWPDGTFGTFGTDPWDAAGVRECR